MIYLTGDTHGEVSRFVKIHREFGLGKGDTLVVAGDFGCIFGLGRRDEEKLDALSRLPYTILFLDGNHECFPKLYDYPEEMWQGGRAHRIRPNLLHLARGQVFELEGLSVFTMGGGYSIDVALRLPGVSWWPQEMPSEAEYAEAWANLQRHDNRVDILISHAAPEETMERFIQMGVISHRFLQEARLNGFLEEVRRKVAHRHYYFGHMHLDRELWRNQTAVFTAVYNLATGERCTEGEHKNDI